MTEISARFDPWAWWLFGTTALSGATAETIARAISGDLIQSGRADIVLPNHLGCFTGRASGENLDDLLKRQNNANQRRLA
jgi:hypothetical protein